MTATTFPSDPSLLSDFRLEGLPLMTPAADIGAVVTIASGEGIATAIDVAEAVARRLDAPLRVVDGDASDTTVVERLLLEAHRSGGVACVATPVRNRLGAFRPTLADLLLDRMESPIIAVGPSLGVLTSSVPSAGVLVWLDGTDRDHHTVAAAARWAALLGEPLTLFTAIEPAPPTATGGPPQRRFGPSDPHVYLSGVASSLAPGQDVHLHLGEDPVDPLTPLRELFRDRAIALVVAPHTRGARRAIFGSIAMRLLQVSPAPVLLVPSNDG